MKAYLIAISTLLALLCGWVVATVERADAAPARPAVTATEQIEQKIDRWVDERVTLLLAGERFPASGTSAVVRLPDLYAREWGTYLHLSARAEERPELASRADRLAEGWLQLLDPVWGGVHARTPFMGMGGGIAVSRNVGVDADYEKRLSDQAGALQVFAAAYSRTREVRYLRAIERIDAYLLEWLADGEGLFFAGQSGVPTDPRQRIGAAAYWQLNSEHQRRSFGLPERDQDRPPAANKALSIAYLCAYRVISDPNYQAVARRIEAQLRDLPLQAPEVTAPGWSAEWALGQLPEEVDVSWPLPEGLAELGLQLRSALAEGSGCGLGQ